jgi:hypothetical protein
VSGAARQFIRLLCQVYANQYVWIPFTRNRNCLQGRGLSEGCSAPLSFEKELVGYRFQLSFIDKQQIELRIALTCIPVTTVDEEGVVLALKLNLIAIYASFTTDLRYLDALNYYHELLPSAWRPESPHNSLRVSLLIFYVRALAVHFTHIN